MPDAGWYRDPQDPSAEEYWDGQAWSGTRRPSSSSIDSDNGRQRDEQATTNPQQAWGQRPTYGPPQGYGYPQSNDGQSSWSAGASAAPRRRRKAPLIVAAVIVVALVATGVTVFLLRSGGNSAALTYGGKEIATPDSVLSSALSAVDAHVSTEHGAKSNDTRCYFAQPDKPARGAKASDIDDSLICGPVLFLDGHPSAEYVTTPLFAADSGSPVHLSFDRSTLASATPDPVPKTLTLVRPDGATPPSGNGGLSVPTPPAAAKDTIVSAVLRNDRPAELDGSSIVSRNQGLTLLAAGRVSSYGDGADARSAPNGQELIAFQITSGAGVIGSSGTAQPMLLVNGTSRTIPAASGADWDVAAVPAGSKPVISLNADGYTQTLSLPDGKPGADNIDVLTRSSTSGYVGTNFSMHSTLSKKGAAQTDKIAVEVTGANLYFWTPLHPQDHPAHAGSAFLSVNLTYKNPSEPGKILGYDPELLRLQLSDGRSVRARNLARTGHIYNVFVVPAEFTSGTLVIGGSANLGHGVRQQLKETKRVSVQIPN